MSWAAHDFETYVIQRHLGLRVSFLALVIGTYAPDGLTKWYVYGVNKGPFEFGASDPAQFHRGWPGAGFTHSIAFILVLSLLVWAISRSGPWAFGFMVGGLAHIFTDTCDSVGCMLIFPFSTYHFHTGVWAYAAEVGRYDDAGAYYSSLGVVMDAAWLVIALFSWRMLKADYFRAVIVPADGAWRWMSRWAPESAMLALYRAGFFYGTTRLIFWTLWAHVANDYAWDLSWGGPGWVEAVHL